MDPNNPAKKRRIYSKLPVVIVEDHHEVLKHIYRAIATRHLPFENISMIHLDSHPDLQIPSKIPAQDIFSLNELSKHLSIENWIIPAVYAGHINQLVWVKPPWADQLPEGPRQVTVGRHLKHGTIRIDWPDEYYLSDVMYAATEDMTDSKLLNLSIVTLQYQATHAYSKFQTVDDLKLLQGSHQEEESNEKASYHPDNDHPQDGSNLSSNSCRMGNVDRSTLRNSNVKNVEAKDECSKGCLPQKNQAVMEAVQGAVSAGRAVILDIDLDFFSTQNPFKLEYTFDQYNILKELYQFEAPKSNDKEELRLLQERRAEQLSDLKNAITWCLQETSDSTDDLPKRWQRMKTLVDDLRTNSKEPLNGELIHMAGETTCDEEDDLPHHVSSEEEITALINRVKEVLSGIPPPVMVTIARSSEDDYCPKRQVGQIQELVVNMLRDLYTDIELKIDFETEISSPSAEVT